MVVALGVAVLGTVPWVEALAEAATGLGAALVRQAATLEREQWVARQAERVEMAENWEAQAATVVTAAATAAMAALVATAGAYLPPRSQRRSECPQCLSIRLLLLQTLPVVR